MTTIKFIISLVIWNNFEVKFKQINIL